MQHASVRSDLPVREDTARPYARSDECWRFGTFSIDRRRRLLLAGDAPVKLDAKAFDLLEYLVGRRDETPSREEILAHVWRGTTVSENNLSVQLSALRRVLLDHGGGDKLILTLPGRRYRFVGDMIDPRDDAGAMQPEPVTPPGASDVLPARKTARRAVPRSWLVAAIVLALSAIACMAWLAGRDPAVPRAGSGLSIVVLPFRNLSDASQNYLADAVTDDLTTELARSPRSVVIARETAETYANRRVRAHEIGRSLNVKYVLEGGVSPDEASLHVNARLIDAQTDAEVWAKRFSVPRDRMEGARDLLVSRIVATLAPVFVQAENTRSRRDRPDNPDAVDLLLRARSILDLGETLEDYQSAQALLERAIAQQPDFEEALADLGWLLVCKVTTVDDPDDTRDEARAGNVIGRALHLTPRDGRALTAQAKLLSLEGDYAAAIVDANAALSTQPNDVDALWVLGSAAYFSGHLDEAAVPVEASLRLDPEGPTAKLRTLRLGNIRLLQGRYAEAGTILDKALAGDVLPAPGEGQWGREEAARLMRMAALVLTGRQDEARAAYAVYATRWLHRSVWRIGMLPPRTLSALPGFAKFLDALSEAGMPRFADEAADDHVPPSAAPLAGGFLAPTPATVPNAATLTTQALAARLRGGQPMLVVDIGTGTAVIDGAVWARLADRSAGDDAYVAEQSSAFLQRHPGCPIVVMADGTYGSQAYNAALHLAAHMHTQVFWYRGGEEAWAKAGFPSRYRRSD